MDGVLLEILFVLALAVANGVFAMAEIAVISARRARLAERAEAGHAGARAALELSAEPGAFLSTVQVGITVIGVLAGAVGGATLAERLAVPLGGFPALAPYREPVAFAVVVGGIAFVSLVVGELVPKRLALEHAERLAAALAPPMRALARVASPLVRLLDVSSTLILHILRVRPTEEPAVTAAEVRHLIELGARIGVFDPDAPSMVRGVLNLGDRAVNSLMTPRPAVRWLDLDDPLEANLELVATGGHSRFPVARADLDHALGVVAAHDVLARRLAGEAVDLAALARPAPFVLEHASALEVLEQLKLGRASMAFVVNEYGSLEGIVTLHDVLEAIVGAVELSMTPSDPPVVARPDGSWLVDGTVNVDTLAERLGMTEWDDELRAEYQTLGGFVMAHLGRIPATGDAFAWRAWRVEVIDMDGRRVDKVMLAPGEAEGP